MMWLNWSVATINATLQLLDIYRFLLKTLKKHSMLFAKLWRNINAFCNRNQLCWYDESTLASLAPSEESVPSSSRKKSKWLLPCSCNTKNTIVSARKGMINLKILHAFNIVGIVDSDSSLKYVYEILFTSCIESKLYKEKS